MTAGAPAEARVSSCLYGWICPVAGTSSQGWKGTANMVEWPRKRMAAVGMGWMVERSGRPVQAGVPGASSGFQTRSVAARCEVLFHREAPDRC